MKATTGKIPKNYYNSFGSLCPLILAVDEEKDGATFR
jgi:hypothetical protein